MKRWEIHARSIMKDFCFPMAKINQVIDYAKAIPNASNDIRLNYACRKARELL
jgi:hypothetical protein|nr:MAG TPA: hypothetical protein [Caudoviricetes sp.]